MVEYWPNNRSALYKVLFCGMPGLIESQNYQESGRWQAPAAVLPPEGWQRGRGPEGPEDKGHGHSRARRAREWPKHASPRARRARGRAKLSARLGACQCYYQGAGKRPRQCCHQKKGKKKRHGHSRARRAREWPKHASPRARRARGRAKVSARLGACQCHYMFFTTQLKIAKFMGRSHDLNVGQKS